MKKVNFRNVLMGLLMVFAFLVTGTEKATAQSGDIISPLLLVPQGNFVNSTVAKDRLIPELESMKVQLQTLLPGSTPYINTERRYMYFEGIDDYLQTGKPVAEAIRAGLGIFMSDAYALPDQTLMLLRQDAIAFLSN
jgi:hypothetical protein